jgi:outer membrane protein OmpA-like peptidoglycan-associated protein
MRPKRSWPAATGVFLASIAASCAPRQVQAPAPQPQTLVVALEDESGSPSRVVVSNASGSVELSGTREATRVSGSSAPTPGAVMDEASVQKIFGETLSDLPRPLQRFNLYFQLESDELTDESRALVPEIVRAVSERPVPDVTVIGHTDTTGAATANYELGLKRASAIRTLLVSSGVSATLVEVASHGEADLLVATPDDTAEPRNRRVEITVK